MKLSSIYEDETAAMVFADTVSLLRQGETRWGIDIQSIILGPRRTWDANITYDPSEFDRVMSDPDSMGHLSYPNGMDDGAEVIFVEADDPIEVFRETSTIQDGILYMRTNRGKGAGGQKIPLGELPNLILKMEQILLPFVKFDNYVKQKGNRSPSTRAVATDVFLEAGGSPSFLREYYFGNPMEVPCIVSMRTRNGKGAKSSQFRLQDTEEIIKGLKVLNDYQNH